MSTRVTSAIASRKARENLVRLLFPKDPHLTVGRTGTTTTSTSSSSSSVSATPLWTDRHSHSRRKQQHRQQRQGNTSFGDTASNNHNNQHNNKRHSYSQLRVLYLKKVHDMHPDKVAHKNTNTTTTDTNSSKEEQSDESNNGRNFHLEFIELKNAWEEYHTSVRIIRGNKMSSPSDNFNYKQQQQGDDIFWEQDEEEDNFTMFGVGCSFADSPEERDLRNEIMDQACRGWFSSGSISYLNSIDAGAGDVGEDNNDGGDGGKTKLLASDEDKTNGIGGDTDTTIHQQRQHRSIKLSDDDMFVCGDKEQGGEKESKRRFLVQDVNRFRRKR